MYAKSFLIRYIVLVIFYDPFFLNIMNMIIRINSFLICRRILFLEFNLFKSHKNSKFSNNKQFYLSGEVMGEAALSISFQITKQMDVITLEI